MEGIMKKFKIVALILSVFFMAVSSSVFAMEGKRKTENLNKIVEEKKEDITQIESEEQSFANKEDDIEENLNINKIIEEKNKKEKDNIYIKTEEVAKKEDEQSFETETAIENKEQQGNQILFTDSGQDSSYKDLPPFEPQEDLSEDEQLLELFYSRNIFEKCENIIGENKIIENRENIIGENKIMLSDKDKQDIIDSIIEYIFKLENIDYADKTDSFIVEFNLTTDNNIKKLTYENIKKLSEDEKFSIIRNYFLKSIFYVDMQNILNEIAFDSDNSKKYKHIKVKSFFVKNAIDGGKDYLLEKMLKFFDTSFIIKDEDDFRNIFNIEKTPKILLNNVDYVKIRVAMLRMLKYINEDDSRFFESYDDVLKGQVKQHIEKYNSDLYEKIEKVGLFKKILNDISLDDYKNTLKQISFSVKDNKVEPVQALENFGSRYGKNVLLFGFGAPLAEKDVNFSNSDILNYGTSNVLKNLNSDEKYFDMFERNFMFFFERRLSALMKKYPGLFSKIKYDYKYVSNILDDEAGLKKDDSYLGRKNYNYKYYKYLLLYIYEDEVNNPLEKQNLKYEDYDDCIKYYIKDLDKLRPVINTIKKCILESFIQTRGAIFCYMGLNRFKRFGRCLLDSYSSYESEQLNTPQSVYAGFYECCCTRLKYGLGEAFNGWDILNFINENYDELYSKAPDFSKRIFDLDKQRVRVAERVAAIDIFNDNLAFDVEKDLFLGKSLMDNVLYTWDSKHQKKYLDESTYTFIATYCFYERLKHKLDEKKIKYLDIAVERNFGGFNIFVYLDRPVNIREIFRGVRNEVSLFRPIVADYIKKHSEKEFEALLNSEDFINRMYSSVDINSIEKEEEKKSNDKVSEDFINKQSKFIKRLTNEASKLAAEKSAIFPGECYHFSTLSSPDIEILYERLEANEILEKHFAGNFDLVLRKERKENQ